ncbi:MAG: bifunctional methylenetetrahydrofolate dehydrogenase/methenyltetrahydrofolate cyclohydrolase FolD [bacterium]
MINPRCNMGAIILDGNKMARDIRKELKSRVQSLADEHGRRPGLAVLMAGDDPASKIYVKNKIKACEDLNIYSELHALPHDVPQADMLILIRELNARENIDGILVQLPLPPHLPAAEVTVAINPDKDVDGLHPLTMGKLLLGLETFFPCTPMGILEILHRSDTRISGKEAVIIGRSSIVGKPLALLLLKEDATVTICHSKTENISGVARRADILVVAAGRPEMVTEDFVKEGAVVIDVGINRVGGTIVGDVNFREAGKKASAITPVPGGVGPLTIAMLMRNTVRSAEIRLARQAVIMHPNPGGG